MTIISVGESVAWTEYLTVRKKKTKKWAGVGVQPGQLKRSQTEWHFPHLRRKKVKINVIQL